METKDLTVLGIDDCQDDLVLLQRHLEDIPGVRINFRGATTSAEGIKALEDTSIDVIFLDYLLGPESGMDVLEQIRARGDVRALIVLTGMTSASLAVSLTHAGADDYLDKGAMSPEVCRRAIDNAQAQQCRREASAQNAQLLDELTDANRLLQQKNTRLAELYNTAHQFVDNVSHEFRTPLAVIKEYASLIRDGVMGSINTNQEEFLDVIGNRVEDLALMVDDMLDISRFGAGMLHVTRRPTDVEAILGHIRPNLDRRAQINKVTLELEFPPHLPRVYCDPEKIGRTIINLVVNAIKFAPEGGLVRIWARYEPNGHHVVLGVTDNGPGISDENRKLIFERFKQVGGDIRQSTKGFGLGLNIAKELVHVNFGEISVKSELGQGSTFSFTIPTAEPAYVIARYTEWLGLVNQPVAVSMIWAKTDPTADPAVISEIGELLRKIARPRDLVFAAAQGLWLIVAQCEPSELAKLLERHADARDDVSRNRPGGPLPPVAYDTDSTWRLPDQTDAFLQRFAAATEPEGVACG